MNPRTRTYEESLSFNLFLEAMALLTESPQFRMRILPHDCMTLGSLF